MTASSPLGVLVQAGGVGRRLGALSVDRPKALVPFAGSTLLEHQLGLAEALRPARLCVLACAAPRAMAATVAGRAELLVEEAPLGTAGGLALLPKEPEAWLVVNVDHVSDVSWADLARAGLDALARGDAGLAALAQHEVAIDEGVVDVEQGHIVGWRERPVLRLAVTTGLYVLSRAAIAEVLPRPMPMDMPTLISALRPRVAAFSLAGTWIDAGTPERLSRAERLVLTREAA